ncbi:MAG: hypothetical protein ACRYFU_02595 [Janthinobacterium lividum]
MRFSLLARMSVAFLLVAPALLCPGQSTKATTAAFRNARNLYYTPVDQGLQGFQCEVAFNWKQFIEKANSAPVQDTDERLHYLQSIKLSVTDDLHGTGSLEWLAPTTAPDASEASITQIRTGLQGLWSGFFQSWNGFYNGELISQTDNTSVERTANGYHVFTRQGARLAEEQYSNDLTLETLHVGTPEIDSVLSPVFERTPRGRVVTQLNSIVKRPPTAAGTSVKMAVQYAEVNGFQLPSALDINVAGAADFSFRLANCTVRTQLTDKPTALTPKQ